MAKYTYEDIIINPEDPRLEIGAEYFFGDDPYAVLIDARNNNLTGKLVVVSDSNDYYRPFKVDRYNSYYSCLIRKKESKYVPFDLNREEVRESLMMKKIINKDGFSEEVIWRFMNILSDAEKNTREWIINNSIHENDLLKHWTFSDGTPCGELVGITSDDGLSEAENDN